MTWELRHDEANPFCNFPEDGGAVFRPVPWNADHAGLGLASISRTESRWPLARDERDSGIVSQGGLENQMASFGRRRILQPRRGRGPRVCPGCGIDQTHLP